MWFPALSWANPMAHTGFIRKLLLHHQHKPFPIPVMLQWLLHWLLLILVMGYLVYLGWLLHVDRLLLLAHTLSKLEAVAPPLAHWDLDNVRLTGAPQLHWRLHCRWWCFADDEFPELHIMPPKQTIVSLGYKSPVELHHFALHTHNAHTHTQHTHARIHTQRTHTDTTHNKKTATKTQPQANTLSLASIRHHGRPPRFVVPVEIIGAQNLVEPSRCSHKLSLVFWHNSTGL